MSIGLQLFSLQQLLNQDLEQGISMIYSMGYDKLELFGPYPFSVKVGKVFR